MKSAGSVLFVLNVSFKVSVLLLPVYRRRVDTVLRLACSSKLGRLAGRLLAGVGRRHVGSQQRHESVGVLHRVPSPGGRALQRVLGERRRRVPDGAGVLGLRAHQLAEALPEARGEQAVDDGVDRRAEVEEDAREQVDVLVDVVHQVRPLGDGAPQDPLDVEGRPAHSERRHHDSCRGRSQEKEEL